MPNISFKTKIIDFNCRFSQNFTNNTRKHDLAFPCYYRIYVSLQGRFLRPTSENKPPTCSFLSIARLQSYPADRKNVTLAFGNFTTNFMIIDTAYPCAEKNILETRCSLIYNYFVIFVLTWTKSGIITSMTLLRGLKVRITTDRKGRHTLLLGFPLYINLKQQMAVFMDGSFCLAGEHNRFALTSMKNGLRVRITADKKDRYTLLLGFPYFINLEQQLTVAWKDCFASQFHIIVSLNMLTLTISKKETSSRLDPLYHFQNKVQPAYT